MHADKDEPATRKMLSVMFDGTYSVNTIRMASRVRRQLTMRRTRREKRELELRWKRGHDALACALVHWPGVQVQVQGSRVAVFRDRVQNKVKNQFEPTV